MTADVQLEPKAYLGVLHEAYRRHYTEQTDVWTDDMAMRCVPALVQGQLKLAPSARALDVGCGSGRDVEYLSEVVGTAMGIDIFRHSDWDRIAQAGQGRVTFAVADFLSYDTGDRYDLVLDNGCFHHQHEEDHGPYLAKAACLLAPGGRFVLSTFKNPALDEYVDGNGRIHRYFTDEQLHEKLLHAGLVVVHELEIHRVTQYDSYRLSFCRGQG